MERRRLGADCCSPAQEIALCNYLNHLSRVTGGELAWRTPGWGTYGLMSALTAGTNSIGSRRCYSRCAEISPGSPPLRKLISISARKKRQRIYTRSRACENL